MNSTTKIRLVDKIKKIYHSSPLIVIKTFSSLYNAWGKIRSYWLPVHLYKGIARDGGKPLDFFYLGWNYHVLNYYLTRIYDQYEKVPGKKHVPAWKINKISNGKIVKGDLAIVELLNTISLRRARKSKGFIFPRWLKTYMDVDLSLSVIKKGNDIPRRIRKFSLESEISTSSRDFELFYEKMHKPYVESRHRNSAYIEDYKKMLQDFKKKNSTLYFVLKDGRRVAGLYEQNPDGIPYMYGVGVLDGSEDLMKKGAVGALYYFALEDHRDNNIKRVNIGGTSPLLKDGLTRFKLSVGAMASEFQYQDSIRLCLLPLRNSPAVKNFLTSNPFTYFENNNVNCAVFIDKTNPVPEAEVQKLLKKTRAMGIKDTKFFCFSAQNGFSECEPGVV